LFSNSLETPRTGTSIIFGHSSNGVCNRSGLVTQPIVSRSLRFLLPFRGSSVVRVRFPSAFPLRRGIRDIHSRECLRLLPSPPGRPIFPGSAFSHTGILILVNLSCCDAASARTHCLYQLDPFRNRAVYLIGSIAKPGENPVIPGYHLLSAPRDIRRQATAVNLTIRTAALLKEPFGTDPGKCLFTRAQFESVSKRVRWQSIGRVSRICRRATKQLETPPTKLGVPRPKRCFRGPHVNSGRRPAPPGDI
jgi:hypothetical protein